MEGEKKRKRKRYLYRVKGLNYFIYTQLIGGSRLPRLPSDRLKRWQGKMVHRRKSCVTPGGGGWRRFNEGSFSPAYIAPPLRSNFFFFPPPPFALCNARLSFTPPCHLDPIHGGGNYLCKEAREGRGRSNEPSTIGTRLGPGNDLCPFSTPISAGCLGEKKEGGRGGCVWGPRHLISFRVNAGNPGLLEGCSPSFKKDFVRK